MANLERYYAFIRAINVGGRRLTNDELIAPFVELGFRDVAGYQAAGNVTFTTDQPQLASAGSLSDALSEAYGFDAPVFVRSASGLHRAIDAELFDHRAIAATAGRIQIAFMHGRPSEDQVAQALELVPGEDRVIFSGSEWFWLPHNRISDSTLPVAKIERIVGPMTVRTLGTIKRMLTKFGHRP